MEADVADARHVSPLVVAEAVAAVVEGGGVVHDVEGVGCPAVAVTVVVAMVVGLRFRCLQSFQRRPDPCPEL